MYAEIFTQSTKVKATFNSVYKCEKASWLKGLEVKNNATC